MVEHRTVTAIVASSNLVNPPNFWGRSTKAVRLIVDQEGAGSIPVYPALISGRMPLGVHLENVRVSTFFVALRNFGECRLGVHLD